MDPITYTGEVLLKKDNIFDLDVYIPSPELVQAVNLALMLRQPLLLMSEPGCGKTRLAESVAAELHGRDFANHYFQWNIKSTSKAKEGIYQYDALRRMYDANAGNTDAASVANYISYGKFAKALTSPPNPGRPNILLIDEIDKADIDFPNDLLLEIEKNRFEIPELGEIVDRTSDVVIFITSNRERELPPAFLRRCLYYYIPFPDQKELNRILSAKFGGDGDGLLQQAVQMFADMREKIELRFAETDKKPSTGELLKWFEVIQYWVDQEKTNPPLPAPVVNQLSMIRNYKKGSVNDTPSASIPFPQVLLKTWESGKLFNV